MVPVPLASPEVALVRVVNSQRVAFGLPRLRLSRVLSRSAERHSRDQLRFDRLSHESSDGTSFERRIARVGRFDAAGEVIAFAAPGSASRARGVVRLWMSSPGHRDQLLNPSFRVIGVGRVRGGLQAQRGAVVTVDFAQGWRPATRRKRSDRR